MTRNPSVNRFY